MKNALTLLFLCAWLAPQSLSARHILGGSMGYYFTQDGQLKLEMVLYRDCSGFGATFDDPAEIAVYKPSGELFSSFTIPLDSIQAIALDSSACYFSLFFCIERGYYTFPLSLPEDGNTYTIVYQRCCRANDITNLVSPAEVGYTMSVEISALARTLKNNSPRWTTDPRFNICVHQAVEINCSAAESDGDLLVYSFCNPLAGGGNLTVAPDLFYCLGAKPTPPCPPPFDLAPFAVPNYSFNNPLGAAASHLNTVNGLWSVTPDYLGKFSYGICVQEFRNNLLLSSTQLELTLFVQGLIGTSQTDDSAILQCSPNPAGNSLTINTKMFEGKPIQIELADLSGKIWFSEKQENTGSDESLDLTQLPAGFYFVKILTAGKTASGRFVHQ